MPALPFCTRVVSGTSNTLLQHCATLRKWDGTWIRAIPPGRRRFTRRRFLATQQPFEFSWTMVQILALGIPQDLRHLTWPVNGTRLRLSKRWLTQPRSCLVAERLPIPDRPQPFGPTAGPARNAPVTAVGRQIVAR